MNRLSSRYLSLLIVVLVCVTSTVVLPASGALSSIKSLFTGAGGIEAFTRRDAQLNIEADFYTRSDIRLNFGPISYKIPLGTELGVGNMFTRAPSEKDMRAAFTLNKDGAMSAASDLLNNLIGDYGEYAIKYAKQHLQEEELEDSGFFSKLGVAKELVNIEITPPIWAALKIALLIAHFVDPKGGNRGRSPVYTAKEYVIDFCAILYRLALTWKSEAGRTLHDGNPEQRHQAVPFSEQLPSEVRELLAILSLHITKMIGRPDNPDFLAEKIDRAWNRFIVGDGVTFDSNDDIKGIGVGVYGISFHDKSDAADLVGNVFLHSPAAAWEDAFRAHTKAIDIFRFVIKRTISQRNKFWGKKTAEERQAARQNYTNLVNSAERSAGYFGRCVQESGGGSGSDRIPAQIRDISPEILAQMRNLAADRFGFYHSHNKKTNKYMVLCATSTLNYIDFLQVMSLITFKGARRYLQLYRGGDSKMREQYRQTREQQALAKEFLMLDKEQESADDDQEESELRTHGSFSRSFIEETMSNEGLIALSGLIASVPGGQRGKVSEKLVAIEVAGKDQRIKLARDYKKIVLEAAVKSDSALRAGASGYKKDKRIAGAGDAAFNFILEQTKKIDGGASASLTGATQNIKELKSEIKALKDTPDVAQVHAEKVYLLRELYTTRRFLNEILPHNVDGLYVGVFQDQIDKIIENLRSTNQKQLGTLVTKIQAARSRAAEARKKVPLAKRGKEMPVEERAHLTTARQELILYKKHINKLYRKEIERLHGVVQGRMKTLVKQSLQYLRELQIVAGKVTDLDAAATPLLLGADAESDTPAQDSLYQQAQKVLQVPNQLFSKTEGVQVAQLDPNADHTLWTEQAVSVYAEKHTDEKVSDALLSLSEQYFSLIARLLTEVEKSEHSDDSRDLIDARRKAEAILGRLVIAYRESAQGGLDIQPVIARHQKIEHKLHGDKMVDARIAVLRKQYDMGEHDVQALTRLTFGLAESASPEERQQSNEGRYVLERDIAHLGKETPRTVQDKIIAFTAKKYHAFTQSAAGIKEIARQMSRRFRIALRRFPHGRAVGNGIKLIVSGLLPGVSLDFSPMEAGGEITAGL